MDVKLLRETDADGLERWEPVMKASFPMSPDDVATVLDALGLAGPTIDRDRYTLDEFVAAFGRRRRARSGRSRSTSDASATRSTAARPR